MDNVGTKIKKSDKIQIRISQEDREIIRKMKSIDPEFNVSLFMRKSLRECAKNLFPKGIGNLKIG